MSKVKVPAESVLAASEQEALGHVAPPDGYDRPILFNVCPTCGTRLTVDEAKADDPANTDQRVWWCAGCSTYHNVNEVIAREAIARKAGEL